MRGESRRSLFAPEPEPEALVIRLLHCASRPWCAATSCACLGGASGRSGVGGWWTIQSQSGSGDAAAGYRLL
eukprot:4395799-Prymnesium_polylepis.1